MRRATRRWSALVALAPVLIFLAPVSSGSAQASDSSTGQWSAPFDIGGVAIHATLTHTGDVLFFQYVEGQAGLDQTSLARTWNYLTGAQADVPFTYNRDLFCAGHDVLPDGRVFIAGGHDHTSTRKKDGVGVTNADIYDPVTRLWSPASPLAQARWYPTNVGLPNGRSLIFGGQAKNGQLSNTVEMYDPVTGAMSTLPSSATKTVGNYPRMHLMSDGTILKTGPARTAASFDPRTNQWKDVAPMLFGQRARSASILFARSH